jgi:hypothetical protein
VFVYLVNQFSACVREIFPDRFSRTMKMLEIKMFSTEWGPAFYYYIDSDTVWFVVCPSEFATVLSSSSSDVHNYGPFQVYH